MAIGGFFGGADASKNPHVELLKLPSSKWELKMDYPYSEDIGYHCVLPFEKTFIIFGGWSYKRRVLIKNDLNLLI